MGIFIGGLRPNIADGIHMFKPQCLKDATSLARMRDEQFSDREDNMTRETEKLNHN